MGRLPLLHKRLVCRAFKSFCMRGAHLLFVAMPAGGGEIGVPRLATGAGSWGWPQTADHEQGLRRRPMTSWTPPVTDNDRPDPWDQMAVMASKRWRRAHPVRAVGAALVALWRRRRGRCWRCIAARPGE